MFTSLAGVRVPASPRVPTAYLYFARAASPRSRRYAIPRTKYVRARRACSQYQYILYTRYILYRLCSHYQYIDIVYRYVDMFTISVYHYIDMFTMSTVFIYGRL